MADYVMAKVVVRGDATSLASFRERHLAAGTFDFNPVIPIPAELMIEQSSAPGTGYDALYGDWGTREGAGSNCVRDLRISASLENFAIVSRHGRNSIHRAAGDVICTSGGVGWSGRAAPSYSD